MHTVMEAGLAAGAMRLRGTPRGADCERPFGACPIRPQPLLRASSTASCRPQCSHDRSMIHRALTAITQALPMYHKIKNSEVGCCCHAVSSVLRCSVRSEMM